MARFDVYRLPGTTMLVLDIQADLFSDLSSRAIVPLIEADLAAREAMPRLKPTLSIDRVDYRMITTDIAAVPANQLTDYVCNSEDQRGTIIDAVDFLLQGF